MYKCAFIDQYKIVTNKNVETFSGQQEKKLKAKAIQWPGYIKI